MKNNDRYFIGVIDVEEKFGNIFELPNAKPLSFRYFNDKFVNSPEKALAVALDLDNERYKKPLKEIFRNVKYDPGMSEYVVKKYYTTNFHTPTPKQMEKFFHGEYKFHMDEYRIQILETSLVKNDLLNSTMEIIHFGKN